MYNDELIESSKIKWQLFLKGDDDAYAWLYSRYVQQLYQYGCRFTTDTEMVKDCVQDVFVNVYRQKDRYSSPPDKDRKSTRLNSSHPSSSRMPSSA